MTSAPIPSQQPSSQNPQQPPSPSSPPPTIKPLPLTPGSLSTRLSDLFHLTLTQTLKSCSYPSFAACFPTPAAKRPETLKSVWSQIIGKMEAKAKEEFEVIMTEREVVKGLNGLEALVGEGKGRRDRERDEGQGKEGDEKGKEEREGKGQNGQTGAPTHKPPHTLPPEELYLAHLSPQLVGIQKELESRVAAVKGRNEELVEGILRDRAEIERLLGGLEEVVRDLEGANVVLEGVRVEDIEGKRVMGEGKGEKKKVEARL